MGFKISWVGFRGISKAAALELVGGADTGVVDEVNEHPFSIAEIPGWIVLFSNDCLYVSEKRLALLSAENPVVACQVHEGVMFSASYGYERGQELWSLMHDANSGLKHLDVSGNPPSEFELIRKRASKKRGIAFGLFPIDYCFDIPVETVEAVCPYQYGRAEFSWGKPTFTAANIEREPN